MRIPQFSVRNRRSIRLAAWEPVPRIMLITGPNGCGKSTLLDALRQAPGPNGSILYVGPHRTSGRQQVQMRYLAGAKLLMRDLQSRPNLPGYDGINVHSTSRSAWDFDDTNSYLKYALCQIELDRQAALAERFDKYGRIEEGSMPDVWKPLREMSENLLPHLHFERIDVSDRNHVKCVWNVHAKDVQVDIDDLSSGEKAIVQLFFPLIEHRIQALIDQSKGAEGDRGNAQTTEQVCVLMDEPELHLHPNLQGKVLDYLRGLVVREDVQFVLATHSPTIVEQGSSDELFLLRPSELVSVDENQLTRIASDDEKLDLMRDIFGSMSNLTAMRTVLVVEGRKAASSSRTATDERVLNFLSDRFAQVTILAGGNKTQCKQLAQGLAEVLARDLSSAVGAYALVDRDLETGPDEDGRIKYLPVSMIENLLVDPEVIWKALVLVLHKTAFKARADVEAALAVILDDFRQDEIDRRVKAGIGYFSFRAQDPIASIREQAAEHMQSVADATSEERMGELRQQSERDVASLAERNLRRENFSGKKILETFYRRHMHNTGMSREIFVYECARAARERKVVKRFVEGLFEGIGRKDAATERAGN